MTYLILYSLLTTASAYSIGGVTIQNGCNYNVYVQNTPSAGGGFMPELSTLGPGAVIGQNWTELTNGNGWSLKLSPVADSFGTNILQFEYTFHDDGTIWFDLSEVDGAPWRNDWCITAVSGECDPRNVAYRFSTDDAHGMQACPQDSELWVKLCNSARSSNSD